MHENILLWLPTTSVYSTHITTVAFITIQLCMVNRMIVVTQPNLFTHKTFRVYT